MMSQKIIVCYLRAGSAILDNHILNRLARYFAPRYKDDNASKEPVVHVELFFPNKNNSDGGMSAGIHYGGVAFLQPKQFRRQHWVFHAISATPEQVQRAKDFCRRQVGAPFNVRGFFAPSFLNYSHLHRINGIRTGQKMPWYCSELVAYTLKHAGILDDEQTKMARVHPHSAYHVIQTTCSTFMDCARTLQTKNLQL